MKIGSLDIRCVRRLLPIVLLGLLAGCDQAGDPVEPVADAIAIEAKLDDLFAPPTAAEVEAIRADWARRDISATEATIELTESYPLSETPATLRIVSPQGGRGTPLRSDPRPRLRGSGQLAHPDVPARGRQRRRGG